MACFMSSLLLLTWTATQACPQGWIGPSASGKCMKLTSPSTHAGCAQACGDDGVLACVQNKGDDDLSTMLALGAAGFRTSPTGEMQIGNLLFNGVWLGEYQWPIEPEIKFFWDIKMGQPLLGQKNWGACSNGQRTNYSVSKFGPFQPNNIMGGEDCVAFTPLGYADSVCIERLPCLCELGHTSQVYLNEHGPTLTDRAEQAQAALYRGVWSMWAIAVAIGSLPALLFVLFVECFYVRWQQRAAPNSPAEKSLRATTRLALRRRMLQGGLTLWLGGALVRISVPPLILAGTAAWPGYGYGYSPIGQPSLYMSLRPPGLALMLLSLRPSDAFAIRLAALVWTAFTVFDVYFARPASVNNDIFAPIPVWGVYILQALNAPIILATLVPSIPRGKFALPSRLALRWLWVCVRLFFLLASIESFVASYGWCTGNGFWFCGWFGHYFMVGAFVILIPVLMTSTVRHKIQNVLGRFQRGSQDASAASVVSTMISGDPVEALRSAEERLYCIKLSKLVEADMANNQDSGLFPKTERSGREEVHAFLSHSWRDDPKLKWSAMLQFKKEFEAKHGGDEPKCWLDKVSCTAAARVPPSPTPIYLIR